MSNVAAGKDIDDNGESLNDVEKALNKQGIALRSAKGEWRSFEDVIDEVAQKWKNGTFNDIQKSQIATAIAGVRQQENFRAMMNNWDEVERLTKVAADSTGSATKRMEIYLDSVEAKTKNLKATWEQFVMNLNQSDSYKKFLDMLINILDKIQYVDWKSVSGVLTLFITMFGLAKAAKGLMTFVEAVKAAQGLGSVVTIFSSKLLLIVGAIAAIVIAINSIKNNIDNQVADIDKRVDAIKKEKEAIEEDKKSVQELYNEYQNLKTKQQLSGLDTSEKERMAEVTKELVEQYGFEYSAVDSLNGGYVLATDALTKYMEAKEKQMKQLDEEEKKSKIEKIAKQVKKQNNNKKSKAASENLTGLSFGFDQAKNEMDAVGFFGSLGLEWNAYKYAFGNWGNGNFFDNYDKELQRQYKEKVGEFEEDITEGWNEITSSIVDTLTPSIENSGLSERFTELFTAQIKAGIKNVDTSKLETTESAERLIASYERLLSQPEIKNYSNQLDKKLTEFENKISDKSSRMTLQDYKNYNEALEKQASLSITLLSNMIGLDKAKDIVTESLNQQMSNTGSYFALLSDQIKKDFGEDSQVIKNFDNIAGSIININKQLADGQIDIKNYFNLMKNEIDSIDMSKLEDSFGNIGNYLATMGQITNSTGGQLQSIITSMQQGKKLNNEGVDDIKSLVGILGSVRNSAKKHMTDENGNYKVFKDKQGNDYDSRILFEDTSATDQEALNKLKQSQTNIQKKVQTAQEELQALNQIQENIKKIQDGEDIKVTQNVKVPKVGDQPYDYRTPQKSTIGNINSGDIYKMNADGTSELVHKETLEEKIEKKQKEVNSLRKQENSILEDINAEQNKVNKGMNSYLSDMEKGVNYLDRYNWDDLDKASDTIFQGFADGAFNANSTIDNVETHYKQAALSMADAFIDMTSTSNEAFNSLGDNVKNQLTSISKETLAQIGLTSEATNTEIANAMLQSQSNFNAVVGAMNKNAQTALSEVLKGAGGMLEALGTAIESFTGEIKISIGGIKFNGLKTFASWDGGELFSSAGKPVETSIKFSGSGIDTKSLGAGIRDAGKALKDNAGTLASQWNPIQPNLINKKTGGTGGKQNGYSPSGGGSKKGSGSDYSAEDAANDLKDILNDIEKYEEDIELDLEDQTEQFINQEMLAANRLDTLKEELDYYNDIYDVTENTSKWLETQNKLLDNQSKKVGSLQNAQASIDAQRKKLIKQNSNYNVESWFDSEGNDTLAYGDLINSFEYKKEAIERDTAAKMRAVYNRVSGSKDKDTIKDAKDEIKRIEEEADIKIKAIDKEREKVEKVHDSVGELNDAWKDNQEAIREALKELHDLVKSMRDELLDDITEQLEKAVDRTNKSLEKSVTRMEQLVTIQEKSNDILNETIDTQQELDSELQASLDSFEYLDEQMRELMFNEDDYKVLSETLTGIQEDVASIWEDHYKQIDELTDDTMYKAEYITAETERQLDMKMREYELAKAELDVAKARTNLQNVKNERNVRMFVGGQWIWTADPNAVKDAQQQLADAEREKTRIEREAEQQRLLDKMNKMIDSDNLQIDENNELLERIQEAIEEQTTEVKSIEDALANASGQDLPALNDVLQGAFGKDGGDFKEIMTNLNKGQTALAAALDGKTTEQAEAQLKRNDMSKSEFEALVKKLGYGWDEKTGTVTTWDGSFKAHYKGWKDTSKPNAPLGTGSNGTSVTGGGANGGSSGGGNSGGGGNNQPTSTKSLDAIAKEVIRGKWGNGTERRRRLTAAGYDYNAVQSVVNQLKRQGYFDLGGLATGKGILLKDVKSPERVLSPQQTKSFDRLVDNLTSNPVLQALTKNVKGTSSLKGLVGGSGETKQYYFSNFTVKADNLTEFIDSLEGMIPITNK